MTAREVPVTVSLPASKTPRSQGIHVSAIIRCIAAETGILKAEWVEDLSLVDVREITDQTAVLRIMIGLAWESLYLPELAELGVIDHPGEMRVDGIYMTHDGESVSVVSSSDDGCNHYGTVVHECKATYKSTRTVGNMGGQFMWMSQVKAYCKGKGTRHAMMHVLFLCGDYTFPIKPVLKVWEIEFTQAEIDQNWALITGYLQKRMREETA
jgi:hypothetical protein